MTKTGRHFVLDMGVAYRDTDRVVVMRTVGEEVAPGSGVSVR